MKSRRLKDEGDVIDISAEAAVRVCQTYTTKVRQHRQRRERDYLAFIAATEAT